MPFPSREAQTRVKHEILREYAGAYGGIISRGVGKRAPAGTVLDLGYFDAFAGFGRYAGDVDQPGGTAPVWGSPILALRALAAVQAPPGVRIRVTGILVEEQADAYGELLENLRAAGLVQRILEVERLDHIETRHCAFRRDGLFGFNTSACRSGRSSSQRHPVQDSFRGDPGPASLNA